MPKIPRLGDYLTSDDINNGDVLTIIEQPLLRGKEETGFDRDVWAIKVQLPNKTQKLWTLNKTTYNALWDAYGDESQNWIKHQVQVSKQKTKIRGETKTIIYGEPITEIQMQQPRQKMLDLEQLSPEQQKQIQEMLRPK